MNIVTPEDGLWDADRVASELGITKQHVYRLRSQSQIPYVRLPGRLVRFKPEEIRAWLETRSVPAVAK